MQIDIQNLDSPLFIAWHITNRCNLECIHCLWKSSPTGAFPGELTKEEAINFAKVLVDHSVPYVAISGGEPLLHPAFWEVAEIIRSHDVELKIETNGQLISKSVAKRLAELDLRSIQISVDGYTPETYTKMRPGASFEKTINAIKYLIEEGANVEIVFVPAKFNIHEAEKLIDFAAELGVKVFETGKTMYLGRAVDYWDIIGLTDEEYEEYKKMLERKAKQYEGKMRVLYYPFDIIEEMQVMYRHPPASPLVLAHGKVKLIGSIPYVVADIRKHSFEEMWERYKKGWKHPKVAEWVESVKSNPKLLAKANDLVELDLS
ncbi:MAG: radical SAM protein [Sulfolobaceae archaeon]|nr:radical SAM protein [Sulfolobaceae archaeon]